MFPGNNSGNLLKIEVALTKIESNISQLSHKVGNINQTTNNLEEIVYSNRDSLVNQLSLLQERTMRVESIITMMNSVENRVTKLENQIEIIKSKSNNNTKFLAILFSIILTYMIPTILDKVIPKPSQIQVEQKGDK